MTRSARVTIVVALLGVATALVVFTAMAYLRSSPPTVDFTAGHERGQPVDMTLQTVGTIGFGPHPSWVSFLTETPNGKWVHTTLWDVPANTRVNVTVLEFDSTTPLRNPAYARVTGTIGGVENVNGHPTSLLGPNTAVAHTFTIPSLGINVPLAGVSSSAKNQCSAAPCSLSSAHNVITFSFISPGPGQYPWQCFIPCGMGYLYGNGGPMQTIGYMDGFLKVVG